VLVVLAVMAVLFAAGIVFRIVHPTAEDRLVEDLPRYPRSTDADFPATDPATFTRLRSGFGNGLVVSYVLPRGTSRDQVLRYYGLHMPKSFTRDGPACWARGDSRVLLVYVGAAVPKLDVAVVTDGAECPSA